MIELYEAANKVAGEIPDGFEIIIRLENGAGWVELEQGGERISVDDVDASMSLASQVLEVLSIAKAMDA